MYDILSLHTPSCTSSGSKEQDFGVWSRCFNMTPVMLFVLGSGAGGVDLNNSISAAPGRSPLWSRGSIRLTPAHLSSAQKIPSPPLSRKTASGAWRYGSVCGWGSSFRVLRCECERWPEAHRGRLCGVCPLKAVTHTVALSLSLLSADLSCV